MLTYRVNVVDVPGLVVFVITGFVSALPRPWPGAGVVPL